MKKIIVNLFVMLAYTSAYAQQWVMDEIADERSSEGGSLGNLILGALFIGAIWLVCYLIKDAIETKKLNEQFEADKLAEDDLYKKRHQYITPNPIDLGLSLPILWSDKNLGASIANPEGEWFHWGMTKPYIRFNDAKFPIDSVIIEDLKQLFCNELGSFSNLADYDASTAMLGSSWRTPTEEEMKCLINECNWEVIERSEIGRCWKVTGPNGNYIIIPEVREKFPLGMYAEYWTSSPSLAYERETLHNLNIVNSCKFRIFTTFEFDFDIKKSIANTEVKIEPRLRTENSHIRPVMNKN